MGAIIHSDGRVEIIRDVVQPGDPRLTDARDPNPHAGTHEDGGADEIDSPLDPRAYPLTYDVIAARPSAIVYGVGLYYASDEKILYRSNGATWVKIGVVDFADLDGVPSSFTPAAHASTHAFGETDALDAELSPVTYPVSIDTLANRPAANAFGGLAFLFWTTDEHILYRSDGAAWTKIAVADYADLTGIPSSFTPSAHESTHAFGQTDQIDEELHPVTYPISVDTLANRPAANAYGGLPFLFWTTDEHILYRSNGAAWTKISVADYADLTSITAIDQTIVDAKGDLIGASADNTPAKVPAAAKDGDALTSDSSQSTGVKWGPGFVAVVSQASDLTVGTATLTNTDLVFTYAAAGVYAIDLYLLCSSAATTTGYKFAWDTSVAVTNATIVFSHVLANTGTQSAGDAIADATARGLSSGVAAANVVVPLLAQGLLLAGISGGTCRLQFAGEVAANATLKAKSCMRVMRIA